MNKTNGISKVIVIATALIILVVLFTSCADKTSAMDEAVKEAMPAEATISPTVGQAPASEIMEDTMEEESPTYDMDDSAVSKSEEKRDQRPAGSNASEESYLRIDENNVYNVEEESVITFSLKVDTASYTNTKRYIESGKRPPVDAIRTEELINYFSYESDVAYKGTPFGIYTEIGPSPFSADKELAFIRVKTKDVDRSRLPSSNIVFLIDTSGSMSAYDKLPLLQNSFSMFADTLDKNDRVSIVTYAGSSDVVLDGARGDNKDNIISAIYALDAGGSTAGADGIKTAYKIAKENYIKGGNNRIILASDGDFNVGISSLNGLERLVKEKKEQGINLSILGFGQGNLKDDIMETLSKHGNGNYFYIDDISSAKKVLVDEVTSNMFVVANDVKAQVEFNPNLISNYRLIGYENRVMDNRDFNDDTKDAGEIGIGTDVVMLIEFEKTDHVKLKYQNNTSNSKSKESDYSDEYLEVRIRYKDNGEKRSKLITHPIKLYSEKSYNSTDFNFAKSVAMFCEVLRDSEYSVNYDMQDVIEIAENNIGYDEKGYRRDHVSLIYQYAY